MTAAPAELVDFLLGLAAALAGSVLLVIVIANMAHGHNLFCPKGH